MRVCYNGVMKYTKELLEPIVAESRSYRQVLVKLGLSPKSGGANAYIKAMVLKAGLPTSHFTGNAWSKGLKGFKPGGSPWKGSEHLVLGNDGDRRKAGATLRQALKETGREYKCECCGLLPIWNGKPMDLQVDHKNGKYWDNRPENLRFICPNCHTQTENYGIKNKGCSEKPLIGESTILER